MANKIEKNNWKVYWRLGESSGLQLYLTEYKSRRFIWEASLPYVTIDHQGTSLDVGDESHTKVHGPFWCPLGTRTQVSEVRVDEFRDGFELLVDFASGPYEYTQMWRFHKDGRLTPWLTLHGPGVHDGQTYHPHWRFDFDVGGPADDSVEYYDEGKWQRLGQEGWLPYSGQADKRGFVWRQRDTRSKARVAIRPDGLEQAELFAIRRLGGDGAPFSPRTQGGPQPFPASYGGSAPLKKEDVALWYVAHVPHTEAGIRTVGPRLKCENF